MWHEVALTVVLASAGHPGMRSLDETRTSGWRSWPTSEITLENKTFREDHANPAERAGFEPTVGVTPRGFSKAVL